MLFCASLCSQYKFYPTDLIGIIVSVCKMALPPSLDGMIECGAARQLKINALEAAKNGMQYAMGPH